MVPVRVGGGWGGERIYLNFLSSFLSLPLTHCLKTLNIDFLGGSQLGSEWTCKMLTRLKTSIEQRNLNLNKVNKPKY